MRKLFQILVCAWVAAGGVFAGEVRIAIVPLNEAARPAADLLTSGLSGITNIALVERESLDRAIRERAFAAERRSDVTALGHALHAHGLILLDSPAPVSQAPAPSPRPTGPLLGSAHVATSAPPARLAYRLVSVSSGVVLDAASYPLPLPEPTRWAQLASTRIGRLASKLEVSRERAIPISILNFHSAVATARGAEIERSLGTLLFHRLAIEPEIFVLERKELGRADWEKVIAGDEREFWSGGCLLEGVIDRDGTQKGVVTVHAQLTRPDGTRIPVEAAGPANDLSQVAETLAARILASVRTHDPGTRWDRAGEARRFEEEATWALRWSMWPESYAAADSAWALGNRTQPVASAKIKALIEQTQPDGEYKVDRTRNVYTGNSSRTFDPLRNVAWTSDAPAPRDVPLAIEAAGSWLGVTWSEETSWSKDKAWLELGGKVLTTASAVVRHQYLYGWRSNVYHIDLPILRKLTRDLSAELPMDIARPLILKQGAYWQEAPGHAMTALQKHLAPDPASYPLGFIRDPYEPFWVGWSGRDREAGVGEWERFISGLQGSTNRLDRAFGSILKLATARFDPEIALAQEEFLDATMDEQRSRFSVEIDFPVLDAFDSVLTNRCSSPVTLRRTRLLNQWKSHDFARAKHYLQVARTHNSNRAGWEYRRRSFTQEQARELLPVVDEYARRVGDSGMSHVRLHLAELASKPTNEREAFLSEPVFDPVRFQRLFVEHEFTEAEALLLATRLRMYANQMKWTNDLAKVDARLQAIVAGAKSRSETNTTAKTPPQQVLKVTRLLQANHRDERGESIPVALGPWLEHQGRIISLVGHPRTGPVWRAAEEGFYVAILDPVSGDSKILPQVLTADRHQRLTFQVVGNRLYWISGTSSMGVVGLDSTELRQVKLELPLWSANLVALQDRLFITGQDYIAEVLPANNSLKLLASKRRKPPATDLDDWAGWTALPKLWLARGTILANAGGTNIWSYSPDAGWKLQQTHTGHDGFPFSLSADQTFARCLDEGVWIDGCRETLLSSDPAQLPRWPMPLDYPLTPGMSMGTRGTHAFDGTNLWVGLPPKKLQVEGTRSFMVDVQGRDMTLLWFHPDYEVPAQVPLTFDREKVMIQAPGFLCTTISSGLVFGSNPPLGADRASMINLTGTMWFLPWAELNQWVARHQASTRRLPRSEPERRRFDLNKDGRLDQTEIRAMETDPAWKERSESLEAERILATFDANADSKLDLQELEDLVARFCDASSAVSAPPFSPAAAFGGRRKISAEEFLKMYDRDNDQRLSGQEIAGLSRHLRTRGVSRL